MPLLPKHEVKSVEQTSRWDSLVWPRWLPARLRMPVIAQITGAVALTALIVGPWWSHIPDSAVLESTALPQSSVVPHAPAIAASPAVSRTGANSTSSLATRPAHLNLDVRHSFSSMDLSVTVDGKPALASKLDGSGKRFRMFGKRSERSYTQTLDLDPGVRVVRVRLTSKADKFDQTRVERFDLAAASVAALRVAADKSGMTLAADHPPPPPAPKADPAIKATAVAETAAAIPVPAASPATTRAPQEASTAIELVQSLRSMLIAIAGFIASTATGFLIQEFLRRRRGLIFDKPVKRRQAGF